MELSLEQLPIRKRYLKSHSGGGGWDGGTATAAGSGGDEFISGGGLPAGDGENKSAARGGDLDARLRAGVIRHSSDPKRCLAYYYANKNPSWQSVEVVGEIFVIRNIECDIITL